MSDAASDSATDSADDTATDSGPATDSRFARLRQRAGGTIGWTLLAALITIAPIFVVVLQLRGVTWYPTGDLAQAEMRMLRFFDHPPMVGAAGRIVNESGVQGNHPGPAMFWAIWPLWKLLGGTAWAFEASTATVNAVWAVVSILLARRRLGRSGALLWSLALAGLIGGYGLDALTQAWNPWVALTAFSVFLMACWGVADRDLWMLPVALAAGSWCLQAHVGYIVPVPLILGASVVIWIGRLWRRTHRLDGLAAEGLSNWRTEARSAAFATFVGIGVMAVAWALPAYQQVRNTPGNVSIIVANFTNPDNTPFGLRVAGRTLLQLLNPFGTWLRAENVPSGSIVPGAVVLGVWGLCTITTAWWSRSRPRSTDALGNRARSVLMLHLIVGVALAASVYAISRVFGELFVYTFRWVLTVTALALFSIAATVDLGFAIRAASRATERTSVGQSTSIGVRIAAAAVAALLVISVVSMVRMRDQEIPYATGWKAEADLAPVAIARLDRDTTYHVMWEDPVSLGGLGFGLMLAAERAGFTVTADPVYAAGIERERVAARGASTELHVITGHAIDRWRRVDAAQEIAYVDRRTPSERREYARLQEELFAEIDAKDRPWNLDTPMFPIMTDHELSAASRKRADRMVTIGAPTAVFLTPPMTDAPSP